MADKQAPPNANGQPEETKPEQVVQRQQEQQPPGCYSDSTGPPRSAGATAALSQLTTTPPERTPFTHLRNAAQALLAAGLAMRRRQRALAARRSRGPKVV